MLDFKIAVNRRGKSFIDGGGGNLLVICNLHWIHGYNVI